MNKRYDRAILDRLNYLKQLPRRLKLPYYGSRFLAQARLTIKKPRLGWHIFQFWMHHKIDKEHPRLRNVDLMVTGKCNFRCSHCYASVWYKQELVPLPILEKALCELRSLGVFHFVLQGGEPLSDLERLRAIIKMCDPSGSYISVVTNGSLLTQAIILELKALGVDKIAVSIDSGIPEEHDLFRNMPGSWEVAVRALHHIRQAGLHTGISATVSHRNLHSKGMAELFEFAATNKFRLNLNVANLAGQWEDCWDVLLTKEDSDYLLRKHMEESLDPNAQTIVGRDLYHHHGLAGCPSTKESLSINANGDVFPCVFVHIALGNIRDQSIRSMRDEALKNKFFGTWRDKCLGGEDREFIKTYLAPNFGRPKPLNGREVFGLEGLCVGDRYRNFSDRHETSLEGEKQND